VKAGKLAETVADMKEALDVETNPTECADIIKHIDLGEDLLKRMTTTLEV
jgi:hypothetical protein